MPFTASTRPAGRKLRDLLFEQSTVYLPGCYDALSARLIESAGFRGGAIGGFAVEAALLGGPDLGLITLTELVDHARKIAAAVDIPLIADVDTGFGGVNSIARTVRLLEQADIAGIHIEDQVNPKRCPVLPGRQLVSIEEGAARYAAAVEARTTDDFYIIARTDGDAISYDEEVERANAYLGAGADAVLPMFMELNGRPVDQVTPDDQMQFWENLVRDVNGPLMMVTDPPKGYKRADIAALGVKIISMSAMTVEAAANAMRDVLADFQQTGTTDAYYAKNPKTYTAGRALMELVHLDHYLDFEVRHTTALSVADLALEGA
jgi:2-methylisocitrate lyase-like PEP mutase family enzyme